MAKYVIEYNICVGDAVSFMKEDGIYQNGIVQDISQLPDVWVEGFEMGQYKRWRIGVDRLEFAYSSRSDSDRWSRVEIDDDENVEFVHRGEVGTEEFQELEYTKKKDYNSPQVIWAPYIPVTTGTIIDGVKVWDYRWWMNILCKINWFFHFKTRKRHKKWMNNKVDSRFYKEICTINEK